MPNITTLKSNEKGFNTMVIILLIVFIVLLSFFIFSKQSIRLDEAQSLWQTSHSSEAMVHIVAEDVHVPLYHFMLHYWQIFFGNSTEVTRLLSLLFYIAIIPSIYLLGKTMYSREVGLFAAILVAISPFLNWYGNEIRMYSLFALLTILNAYFFLKIYYRDGQTEYASGWTWFGYAVTATLGIFTHYFFAFNLMTQMLFYFFYRKSFPRDSFHGFLMIAIILAMVYTPWLNYVIHLGAASNTQPHLTPPTTVDVFNTFSEFLFGFQDNTINTILVSLWPLAVLLIFLGLRRNQRVTPATTYFFLSIIVPISLAFIISSTFKPLYLARYMILALPALYLLLSWMLSQYPKGLAFTMRTLVIVTMLATLAVQIVSANTPVKEDYKAASEYLAKYAASQDVIVVSAPFTIYPFLYYYNGISQVETLPIWNRLQSGSIPAFDENTLPAEVDQIRQNHEIVWVLLSYDQGYEEKVRLYFDTHYERLAAVNFSPNLNLYAYRVEYNHTNSIDFNFPVPKPAIVRK